jgi:hypothetical protein
LGKSEEVMKRLFIYIIGVTMALTGCDLEHSENGKLDGLWQLRAVDTLATGGTADMRSSQRVWGVQGTFIQMRLVTSGEFTDNIVCRFNHEGSTLQLTNPYIVNRDEGDVRVNDVKLLQPFGMSHLEETFKVLELSDARLTLESDLLRLHFRRY